MSVYRPSFRDPKTRKIRRSRVWWYSFIFAGKKIQASSKSTRKTIAKAAEETRRKALEQAYAGMPSEKPEQRIRTVREILEEYAQGYDVNHRQSSKWMVKNRSAHLERLLGSMLLSDLTEEQVIAYMRTRQAEEVRPKRMTACRTINLEVQILATAMGSTWKALWPRVKHLEENRDVGRALETHEEELILNLAKKNQSKLIFPYLYTLAWTGLRASEARTLRWGNVNLSERGEIIVGASKTDAGKRRIPMTANLKAVLQQHAAWYAGKAGPLQPDWYVFPLMNRLAIKDPARPVTALRTAWESIRETAKVNCRLHDLRHSFCTKLGEAGIPERTMLDMMGHMSVAMLRRYSHIRSQARRDAIDALEGKGVLSQIPNRVSKESTKVSDSEHGKNVVTH